MKAVVEGEQSEEVTVDSGVPQGTVFGPLLFLYHINDLPDAVKFSVRLFADDCLLYRTIKSAKDHQLLQEDMKSLEAWAKDWGMGFNAKKCYILSIKKQKPAFLQLNWIYTSTSPKQSIPWPTNIRGFKVDNTYCKHSIKSQFDLGLSQNKPQILSTGM